MRRLLLPAIATMLSPCVFGQDTLTDDTPEVRRYTVEVIIFRYAEDVSVGTEVFLPDVPVAEELLPDPADEFVFSDQVADAAPAEPVADAVPVAFADDFVLHGEEDFALGDIASRLERLDVYDPIMHFAWTQETRPEQETAAIDLQVLGPAPEGLSGSFKLYLSRYLHLVVDLTLDDASRLQAPNAPGGAVLSYGDRRSGYGFEEPGPGPVRFRIREDRIFKSGDLRYFDHPRFGVLAKILRVEEPEYEVEPELLGDDPRDLPGGVDQ